MKKFILTSTIVVFSTVSVFDMTDSALLQKAKSSGLKAIPQSKLEVLKLLEDPDNPVTAKKIEFRKKTLF